MKILTEGDGKTSEIKSPIRYSQKTVRERLVAVFVEPNCHQVLVHRGRYELGVSLGFSCLSQPSFAEQLAMR